MTQLVAIHDGGTIAARVQQVGGHSSLVYEEAWRAFDGAIALSVSLPLAEPKHEPKLVEPFLWGLLPDNELVLERWGKAFHVSARNAFRLLQHVGEDCPGAFQLVTEERVARFRDGDGDVDWLTAKEVEARLAAVRSDPSRTRAAGDSGQFSLAGAQPKIALYRDGERWGVPSGRWPTTHILKPPTGDLEGFAENEHYCLTLAAAAGLPVASSELVRFGAEVAIVVVRFDRVATATLAARAAARATAEAAGATADITAVKTAAAQAASLSALAKRRPTLRLHQEDLCQALGVHPSRKYQNEGGPTPRAIASLLRSSSTAWQEDLFTFLDALVFAWVTGGSDAHAKNFALLHGARGSVRLAPLYDLASVLPYPRFDPRRVKLAMSLGGEYGMQQVRARHFEKLAVELGLRTDLVLGRARALAERVGDEAIRVATEVRRSGVRHPIVRKLATAIEARVGQCRAWLGVR